MEASELTLDLDLLNILSTDYERSLVGRNLSGSSFLSVTRLLNLLVGVLVFLHLLALSLIAGCY